LFNGVNFDVGVTVKSVIVKAEAACDKFETRMSEIDKGREPSI